MRLVALLILAARLAQGQAPRHFRVIGFSVLGSGCPYGSASVRADPSNTVFDIQLSQYIVQTGPNTMAADWRKNCKLTLNLDYEPGYQYVKQLKYFYSSLD